MDKLIKCYLNERGAKRVLLKHPDFNKIEYKKTLVTGDRCLFYYKGKTVDTIGELICRESLESGLGDFLVQIEKLKSEQKKKKRINGIIVVFRRDPDIYLKTKDSIDDVIFTARMAKKYAETVLIMGIDKKYGDGNGLITFSGLTKLARDLGVE